MAYQHDLNCPTNQYDPEPPGWCDRCQRKFYLRDLHWQFQQIGSSLKNLRLRVCHACLDTPAYFLAPIRMLGKEGVVRYPAPLNIVEPGNTILTEGPTMAAVARSFIPDEPIEGYPDIGGMPLGTDGDVPIISDEDDVLMPE